MSQETIQLKINGMTCQRCADTVQRALLSHDGVFSAAISIEETRATVNYDPELTTPQDLLTAVQEEGYEAKVLQGSPAQ